VLPQGAPLMVGASSGDDALAREQRGATRGPTVRVFRSEGSASGGRRTQNLGVAVRAADLALISVTDGRVDRIVPAVTVTKTAFSPDGRHVAFSAMSGDNVEGTHIQRYALRVFSLENRKLQTLLPPGEIGRWGYDFSWSPDSRWLAYRMGHDSGEVYLASLDGQV